jgi:methyltransferase-like protein
VTLRLGATPVAAAPGTAPLVDPLVRWQASRGAEVTNRYHEVLDLDPLGQALCQSCDGRHSIAALEHLVAEWLAAGALPALEPGIGVAEAVARQLRRFALAALLVPEGP